MNDEDSEYDSECDEIADFDEIAFGDVSNPKIVEELDDINTKDV